MVFCLGRPMDAEGGGSSATHHKHVVVKQAEGLVRLYIKKSKTDPKGLGTWRTLKCYQN